MLFRHLRKKFRKIVADDNGTPREVLMVKNDSEQQF